MPMSSDSGACHRVGPTLTGASPRPEKPSEGSALTGKRVFIRVDYNVPLDKKTGAITDDAVNAYNNINGNEYQIPEQDDLQYACVFLLPPGAYRNCSWPGTPACECEVGNPTNNPLCDPENPHIQIKAKAYPGIRELALIRSLLSQGIVGSVCPGRMIVSGGRVSSVSMIDERRSAYVVWPGARTPPTDPSKSVSPVKTLPSTRSDSIPAVWPGVCRVRTVRSPMAMSSSGSIVPVTAPGTISSISGRTVSE
mgnify:CR=1 FL=1